MVGAAVVGGLEASSAAAPSALELPPRVVAMRSMGGDFRFDPAGLRVARGDSVIWFNMGDFHTASAFHPANDELVASDVPRRIPEGADPWHSGMLGLTEGTEFTYELGVPGVYDYFCQPHFGFAMVGRIVVDEPAGGPATVPVSGLDRSIANAFPEIETIMGPEGRAFEWAARINGPLYLISHDRSVLESLRTVREAMEADAALEGLLASRGAGAAVWETMGSFAGAVEEGADYGRLVTTADRVKRSLYAAVDREQDRNW